MKTGEIITVKALISWQHPDRGLFYPDEFLSDVEGNELDYGLLIPFCSNGSKKAYRS